jgi:hypothetical protein
MKTLLSDAPEAAAWVDSAKAAYSGTGVFAKVSGSVIWTDEVGDDGEPLVVADPVALTADININGHPLFFGHDPGCPVGRVLAARVFTSSSHTTFVAAVIGLYAPRDVHSFKEFGVDTAPTVSSPAFLKELGKDCRIDVATDPREVEEEWVQDLIRDAPLPVERIGLSHNAADPLKELIRIGLVYMALVWNPFVTGIATEAGKHAYAGIHDWLRRLWNKLADRRNPIVAVESYQDGCQVSFLFRGRDVTRHYAAHEALPVAAAQGVKLIAGLKSKGVVPVSVVYEFEPKIAKWFPSYAQLNDGRIVSDTNILVAIEQLPQYLSIGIMQRNAKPKAPR